MTGTAGGSWNSQGRLEQPGATGTARCDWNSWGRLEQLGAIERLAKGAERHKRRREAQKGAEGTERTQKGAEGAERLKGRRKGAEGTDVNSPSVITLGAKEASEGGPPGLQFKDC